jgi:hypothetical protein
MMSSQTKRPWSKPELIVLVRGRPEEAVLSACKVFPSSGPFETNGSCTTYADGQCNISCNSYIGS